MNIYLVHIDNTLPHVKQHLEEPWRLAADFLNEIFVMFKELGTPVIVPVQVGAYGKKVLKDKLRDANLSKETYYCQKRPTSVKA